VIELYPYLLVFLFGSTVVLAIGLVVQVRNHAEEADIWRKDWHRSQVIIRRANQDIEGIVKKYNDDLFYTTQVLEALVEISLYQGKLINPEDLEEEIDDIQRAGIAACTLLVTVGKDMPSDLVEQLPQTNKFIMGMSEITSKDLDKIVEAEFDSLDLLFRNW